MKKEMKKKYKEYKISSEAFFNILGEIEHNARVAHNHWVNGRNKLGQKYQNKIYEMIEELRQDYFRFSKKNLKTT